MKIHDLFKGMFHGKAVASGPRWKGAIRLKHCSIRCCGVYAACVLLGVCFGTLYSQPVFGLDLPTDVEELKVFLREATATPENLMGMSGTYTLPKSFQFDNREIRFMHINDNMVRLSSSTKKNEPDFPVLATPASIDDIIKARSVGELLDAIGAEDEKRWLPVGPESVLLEEMESREAMILPIRFAYLNGASLVFVKAFFPVKLGDAPVSSEERILGDHGPLRISIFSENMLLPLPPALDLR